MIRFVNMSKFTKIREKLQADVARLLGMKLHTEQIVLFHRCRKTMTVVAAGVGRFNHRNEI